MYQEYKDKNLTQSSQGNTSNYILGGIKGNPQMRSYQDEARGFSSVTGPTSNFYKSGTFKSNSGAGNKVNH